MKIGIIGAVRQEVELLFAALAESGDTVRSTRLGSLEFREGTLDGCRVVIVCCGVGKVNAAICAQSLIAQFGAEAVINTGSAGGLDPRLSVLDMVVSTDAVQHDVDATYFGYAPGQVPGSDSPFYAADPILRKIALSAFARVAAESGASGIPAGTTVGASRLPAMIEGRVASGDVFVSSDGARARIAQAFSPACVEMEGAAIAQVCAAHGVPFVILRSVSDLAGNDAGLSYDDFSEKASHSSARVVREMLAECHAIGR